MHNLHCKSVDRLFQTFLNLQTLEECYAYFEDICTVKEILDMAQRFALTPEQLGMKLGLLVGMVFPIVAIPLYLYIKKTARKA